MPRLSITKWIHLHGGDGGLLEFFRRVYRLLRPGGTFVLEPQEWEGYKSAKRMDRVSGSQWSFLRFEAEGRDLWQKLAESAKVLKLRPEMFGEELVGIGFALEGAYGTPGEGGMCRILYIQAYSTLTAKQDSNAPCMLIANRHELVCATYNNVPSGICDCITSEAMIAAKVSVRQSVADRELKAYGTEK